MEDLYKTLTEALAAWVKAVTGADVKAAEFRVPRSEGQLSVGTFVQGRAQEAADKLNASLCPQVREVRAKNGWLLFFLSDSWFDGLIRWAQGLDTRPGGSYVENRMAILARKGDAPCPAAEGVRRALWRAYLAYRRGFWRAEDERAALTMTHGARGMDRIELENRCGGAAAAILKLRGNLTRKTGKTIEKE